MRVSGKREAETKLDDTHRCGVCGLGKPRLKENRAEVYFLRDSAQVKDVTKRVQVGRVYVDLLLAYCKRTRGTIPEHRRNINE